MVLCLLSRDSHGDTTKLNHEETVRGPEIAIFSEKSEILLLILVKILKKSDSTVLTPDPRAKHESLLTQGLNMNRWRLACLVLFVSGCLLFLSGSVFYYTRDRHFTVGGYCFAAGGVCFFISEPINIAISNQKPAGLSGHLLAILSFSGTVIYLAGCILFIPQLSQVALGTWLFIWGSACFVIVSASNIIRGCSTGYRYAVETCIGLGGTFYVRCPHCSLSAWTMIGDDSFDQPTLFYKQTIACWERHILAGLRHEPPGREPRGDLVCGGERRVDCRVLHLTLHIRLPLRRIAGGHAAASSGGGNFGGGGGGTGESERGERQQLCS
jgi:hypothetical protein